MKNSITLNANAKINLILKVLGKRKDGYHDLYTVFERISLSDKVTIEKSRSGISVTSDKAVTKRQKDNIAYKAAAAIINYSGVRSGVKINITKKIPVAAGLGGGSSDAAAVLVGINRLFNLKLSQKELVKLGSGLGADVPFFLIDAGYAAGAGKGDILKKISSKAVFWHLLIFPGPIKRSTKYIYSLYDKLYGNKKMRSLTSFWQGGKIQTLRTDLINDLERAVVVGEAGIGRMIKRLARLLDTKVTVSGSGPSLFCLYETRREAMTAKARLLKTIPAAERRGWRIFIERTVC